MNKRYEEPVALLYQACPPPVIDGSCKPMKPGGYRDSSADIAYILTHAGIQVITPSKKPDPSRDADWSFADTGEGIQQALDQGARTIWANTILFDGHPLEKSPLHGIRVVGQRPHNVHLFDDKRNANQALRDGGCPIPKTLIVKDHSQLTPGFLSDHKMYFPLVVKPTRGRGSDGVKKVDDLATLQDTVLQLISAKVILDGQEFHRYGNSVLVEEYMPGLEVTVTVMPPGVYQLSSAEKRCDKPWCLPIIRRFNHENGITPYNGVVAVTKNSTLLEKPGSSSPRFEELRRHCEKASALVGAVAPIRVDCREAEDGGMKLFDLNMKPNLTGAGRPGRDDQDSLPCIAARAMGWSYRDLLLNMLAQSWQPGG